MNKLLPIFTVFSLVTVGCSFFTDERIELYKCEQSAMYLNKNEDLMRQAVHWKSGFLSNGQITREEYMASIAKQNKAMSEVMNDNGSLDRSNLLDWYNSDYCETLLSDYQAQKFGADSVKEAEIIAKNQGIDESLAKQVAYYSKSMVDTKSKELSCDKYREQFSAVFNNQETVKYRGEMAKGLFATLKDSSFKLKKAQMDYITSYATDEKLLEIAEELYQSCPNENLVSNQITTLNSVVFIESPKTSEVKLHIQKLEDDNNCGSLSEIYCLANIRKESAKNAYNIRQECDQEVIKSEKCSLSAESLYLSEFVDLEISKLNEERIKYESYISNPEASGLFNYANARRNIEIIAEKCQYASQDAGFKGEAYEKRNNEVCLPKAKLEFVSPEISILEKINARLKKIKP